MKRLSLTPGSVERARELRRNSSDAEKRMWRALREAFPAVKFRRQVPIGPYFVDFCSHSTRLIVEVDGGQHAQAADYDAARTRYLEAQGYRILRFWNNDVLGNIDGVVASISLSLREREGAAQRREGEGDQLTSSLSPSHAAGPRGPLPLPRGEGLAAQASSSNVTATSAFALRRTLSPSTPAISPVEM